MKTLLFNITFLFFLLTTGNAQTDSTLISQNNPSVQTMELQLTIDSLQAEIERLKEEKNAKIDQLADQRLDQLSLIAVLTLVSLFMLLFLYFFLSCRYKKRRGLLEN